jgi:hypothetical protein
LPDEAWSKPRTAAIKARQSGSVMPSEGGMGVFGVGLYIINIGINGVFKKNEK